ncbi:MAG: DUF4176 domain-containing protein [Lachnospiraceae bacterium]|nr:DUF4176 domain-containing protein [Lachnospiraceae bacterium]
MNFTELLPIGSIILLKDAKKRLMIYGIGQRDETNKKDYDYVGVMYPEGNMGEGSQFLFNHGDIDQVFFRGFEDEERSAFLNRIQKMLDEQKESDSEHEG